MSIGAYELAYTLLKVDPGTNAYAEQLAVASSGLLQTVQRAAISLLRVLFVGYPTHRQSMIVENLTLLCHVYTAKMPTKLYPLHFSNQTIGDSGRHASMSFIALLTCLQSLVDISAGLEALQSDEDEKAPTVGDLSKGSMANCSRHCAIFANELMKVCYGLV